MAVMSSQQAEGVAFEQKIQPVPSSDKMALDLDINGTALRNESILDNASPDASLKDTSSQSPSSEVPPNAPHLNGANNADAFASNSALEASFLNPIPDSQATTSSPISAPTSSQFHDTNATTTEAQSSTSPDAQHTEGSALSTSVESAIEAAVDDTGAASSTVPPVIEAHESDLRATSPIPVQIDVIEDQHEESLPTASFDESSNQPAVPQSEQPKSGAANDFASTSLSATSTPQDSLDHAMAQSLADMDTEMATESATTSAVNGHTGNASALAISVAADTEMTDVPEPQLSAKVAREREDDDEHEPSAKRTKMEDSEMTASLAPVQNGGLAEDIKPPSLELTEHQEKEILKYIKSVIRSKKGQPFSKPVAALYPALAASYLAVVPEPIDLGVIEGKLASSAYSTVDEFKADVSRIAENSVIFNGNEHGVTKTAIEIKHQILNRFATIPREVPKPIKKEKKAKRATPTVDAAPRASPARRQSRGAHPAPNPAVSAASDPIFPLNPVNNIPFTRRNSTKADDKRPKRDIHPPPPKDLPYQVRPKTKKHAPELKFCENVLAELRKPKYGLIVEYFAAPVDPVALNIPHYFQVIKKPMDLRTMTEKLNRGEYGNAAEFEKDMRLILNNCYKFNPPGHTVHNAARELQDIFESEWSKKDAFVADHTPAVASPSSADYDEEELEEDEEDAPIEATPKNSKVQLAKDKLLEEQTKLLKLMSDKRSGESDIAFQQQMVDTVTAMVKQAEEAAAAEKKTAQKSKTVKSTKKSQAPKRSHTGPKQKVAAPKLKKKDPQRHMGTVEKETISSGIMSLPEDVQGRVLDMIKAEQDVEDDNGCVELDIESISRPLLWRIYDLVMEHLPYVEEQVRAAMAEKDAPRAPAKPAPKKKNKPMSKEEQERKIKGLQEKMSDFQRHASNSQEPVIPTTEPLQPESSGDESSDSEEE
jgi:bromodomain-containing factor 1